MNPVFANGRCKFCGQDHQPAAVCLHSSSAADPSQAPDDDLVREIRHYLSLPAITDCDELLKRALDRIVEQGKEIAAQNSCQFGQYQELAEKGNRDIASLRAKLAEREATSDRKWAAHERTLEPSKGGDCHKPEHTDPTTTGVHSSTGAAHPPNAEGQDNG